MRWDRFDSLVTLGVAVVAAGVGLWSVPAALVWLGTCLIFVGLRGSLWASSGR